MAYYLGVSGGPVSANSVSGGNAYDQGDVGTLAVTQAADTIVATGTIVLRGVLALTQGADTATSTTGEVDIDSTAGITQAGNTLVATAALANEGLLATSQDDNDLAATAGLLNEGEATLTQASDTSDGSFIVGTFGFLAQSFRFLGVSGYAVSAFSVSGHYTQDRPGAVIQDSDTLVATGGVLVSGEADLTQDDDVIAATAGVRISVTGTITQADNTMTAAADIRARIRLRGGSVGGGGKGGVSTVGGGAKLRIAA